MQILDTAGQEKFWSLSQTNYKKADCCLLIYDITRKKTFEDCKSYFKESIEENCKKNVKVLLLGNKTDLEEEREVAPDEGANFAEKNNYLFMETSCLKNANVADAFETLIEITNREAKKEIQDNIEDNSHGMKISNKNNKDKKKSKKCLFF